MRISKIVYVLRLIDKIIWKNQNEFTVVAIRQNDPNIQYYHGIASNTNNLIERMIS